MSGKLRVCAWINTETMEPFYGLQARVAPRKWVHVSKNGKPFFFPTREEAEAGRRVLAAQAAGETEADRG